MSPFPPDGETVEPLEPSNRGSATWDAVEALAAILEPEAFDPDQSAVEGWRGATMNVALAHAAKVITSGYRLVVDDDTTVDRVARAIFVQARARYDGPENVPTWDEDPEEDREEFRFVARAAIQALREGGEA